jgi:hypothetical protein
MVTMGEKKRPIRARSGTPHLPLDPLKDIQGLFHIVTVAIEDF